MIDPELLRSLGWSEHLIAEFVEAANNLMSPLPEVRAVTSHAANWPSGTTHQVFADSTRRPTTHKLVLGTPRAT
jgi:hypothetical protein